MLAAREGVTMPLTTSLIELASVMEGLDFRGIGRDGKLLPESWLKDQTEG